ncbi:MAG TPA: hypothetical protein VF889_03755 [Bacteroidota bacterium]
MDKNTLLRELSTNVAYWQKLWADACRRNGIGLFVFTPDGYEQAVRAEELEPSIWTLDMFKAEVLTERDDIAQLEALAAGVDMKEEFLVLIVQADGSAEFLKINRGAAAPPSNIH